MYDFKNAPDPLIDNRKKLCMIIGGNVVVSDNAIDDTLICFFRRFNKNITNIDPRWA
jgi:hypothetical protein